MDEIGVKVSARWLPKPFLRRAVFYIQPKIFNKLNSDYVILTRYTLPMVCNPKHLPFDADLHIKIKLKLHFFAIKILFVELRNIVCMILIMNWVTWSGAKGVPLFTKMHYFIC